MRSEMPQKVQARHLPRDAYLYVRRSTLRQLLENTGSTHRRYALRQHAVALGWPLERIIVIETAIWVNREPRRRAGRAFSDWWPRWRWDAPGLSWASRFRAWPATAPTGIACSKSAP